MDPLAVLRSSRLMFHDSRISNIWGSTMQSRLHIYSLTKWPLRASMLELFLAPSLSLFLSLSLTDTHATHVASEGLLKRRERVHKPFIHVSFITLKSDNTAKLDCKPKPEVEPSLPYLHWLSRCCLLEIESSSVLSFLQTGSLSRWGFVLMVPPPIFQNQSFFILLISILFSNKLQHKVQFPGAFFHLKRYNLHFLMHALLFFIVDLNTSYY